MPQDKIPQIESKIPPFKEKAKYEKFPYMDTRDRQSKDSLVNPVGRVISVRDKAPKEEQTSVFTPDKGPIGPMINDKGQ